MSFIALSKNIYFFILRKPIYQGSLYATFFVIIYYIYYNNLLKIANFEKKTFFFTFSTLYIKNKALSDPYLNKLFVTTILQEHSPKFITSMILYLNVFSMFV